jgi:hypothetical protein
LVPQEEGNRVKLALTLAGVLLFAACSRRPQSSVSQSTGSSAGEVPYQPALPDKVPADVPAYPGAKLTGTFSAPGTGADGQPGASQYEFTSTDAPAKIMDYYHRMFEQSGMKLALHTDTADGGMFVAEDDPHHRTVNVIVEKGTDGTTIRVTLRVKG